jgi:hypothetical protein
LLFCEGWEAGCVPVFTAPDPLGPWERVMRVLPGVPAVEPTLVEHEGRWYMFVTSQRDGPNRRLRIYHGDTPLGPWLPHARKIVLDDPSCARPAGPFIRLADGTLVRSGQDCSQTYGGTVQLFRVDRLSPEVTRKRSCAGLIRHQGPRRGDCTLCPIDETSCLIDGKRWIPAPLDPFRVPWRMAMNRLRRSRARAAEEQQRLP